MRALAALLLLTACAPHAGLCSLDEDDERARFEARLRELAGDSGLEPARTRWARDAEAPTVGAARLSVGLDGVRWDEARPMLRRFELDPDGVLAGRDAARYGELLAPPEAAIVSLTDGLAAQTGESQLLPALLVALQARAAPEDGAPTVLVVDRRVPFRTLARVVYTLGQAGHSALEFVVEHRGERALPARLPVLRLLAQREANSILGLLVEQTADGVVVSGSGGVLARGCRTTTRERAPAVAPGDYWALRRCLRRVSQEFPEERSVAVSAEPNVAFEQLAPVLAAVRADALGPLFDDVTLDEGVR